MTCAFVLHTERSHIFLARRYSLSSCSLSLSISFSYIAHFRHRTCLRVTDTNYRSKEMPGVVVEVHPRRRLLLPVRPSVRPSVRPPTAATLTRPSGGRKPFFMIDLLRVHLLFVRFNDWLHGVLLLLPRLGYKIRRLFFVPSGHVALCVRLVGGGLLPHAHPPTHPPSLPRCSAVYIMSADRSRKTNYFARRHSGSIHERCYVTLVVGDIG